MIPLGHSPRRIQIFYHVHVLSRIVDTIDLSCGLAGRVPGHDPEVPGLILGATTFSKK
jgi:hypothetical protein